MAPVTWRPLAEGATTRALAGRGAWEEKLVGSAFGSARQISQSPWDFWLSFARSEGYERASLKTGPPRPLRWCGWVSILLPYAASKDRGWSTA